jgi:hypothetical protein
VTDRVAQLEKAKTKIEALSNTMGAGSDQKVWTETTSAAALRAPSAGS